MNKKYINENAFDTLTPESVYWIGFLTADGCIRKIRDKYKRISLKLCNKDYGHIAKFKKFMRSEHKICVEHSNNNAVILSFTSEKIYDKLIEYGLCERKSFNDFKIIDKFINNRDFWRGCVDDDGTICLKDNKFANIRLAGSSNLIEQFRDYVFKNTGYKYTVSTCGNIYQVNIVGKKAKQIIMLLYENAEIYLDRKYDKAMEFMYE